MKIPYTRTRLTREQKIRVVTDYAANPKDYKNVAKRWNIAVSTLFSILRTVARDMEDNEK